jgi:DNA replication protein DnaC
VIFECGERRVGVGDNEPVLFECVRVAFDFSGVFRDLAMARADGTLRGLLARLGRIDVLVIDDWAMAPLSEPERRDFWKICDDRYQVRSTILTSQLPVSRWHEQIGDPTLADNILDRLVHNAHRMEMRGDSMRRNRPKANSQP